LLFNPAKELGINGHHVFVVAVERAVLHHPDLPVALDNLRFDRADLFVHQIAPILLAGNDRLARFFDARGTKRIRLPREAQRGLGLLPGFQQWLVRPLRRDRRIGIALVKNWMVLNVIPAALQTTQSNVLAICVPTVFGINLYPPLSKMPATWP